MNEALELSPALRTVKALSWLVRERLRPRPAGSLLDFEAKRHSQNGEDGVIAEIFRRIGPGARTFVEFGVGDGRECNTRALALDGWSGVWLEGDAEPAARARAGCPGNVTVSQAFLTAENVGGALESAGVSRNVDLMSIDVDGNDYHLWRALEGFAPRVVVIEYNASVEPGRSWVMPYDPQYRWDLTNRFGASLEALCELATSRGYQLVACDSRGVNAFFVNGREARPFAHPGDVRFHYMSPKYCGLAFGHPSR